MGQAAVDLPDPLQSPPEGAPATATGKTATDELLAQLAGDEIDRLLAEADGGPHQRASAAPFHVGPPPYPEKEIEPEPAPEPALSLPGAPAAESKPSPTEMEVTAELDALFSAAVEKDNAAKADEAAAGTTAAERAGLKTIADMGLPPAAAEHDAPLPLYFRPLEWLSLPLAIFPATVRDLVGKAAIITLLNAAAILAYVLIVRRNG